MKLQLTIQGEITLKYEGEDLLVGCQTQGKNLLRLLTEHYHARVISFQDLDKDRRLNGSVSAALKYLLDTIWPETEPGVKRKVTNSSYTLPYNVSEDKALLCLKRLGKSELMLKILRGHPDVWVDAWQNQMVNAMPSGTVTFLFTDIEGSTALWEEDQHAMQTALLRHDRLMREAIESHGGYVFKTIGDAFCATFESPLAAVGAALAGQLALRGEAWSTSRPIQTRMALHSGSVQHRDNDYFGPAVNRVARLLSIGHGGQVLLSRPVAELVRDMLPEGADLQDKGEHRLKDLQRSENVFQLTHGALPFDFPPLKSLDSPDSKNNLPQQLTTFIGREHEIQIITGLASKTRLLTLMGPGGCGKTRLALQLAADVVGDYPDGAWFVELAALPNADHVSRALANVLGVQEESGKPLIQSLIDQIGSKSVLVVLDNCEHLVEDCHRLADALLRGCSRLKILATSRTRLGVSGELTYRVPPMELPKDPKRADPETLSSCESVRLFMERAQLQRPDFKLTDQNAPILAELCIRLDGIPFALELAAGRIRSMSIEDINSRLDNRFRLLTGGDRMALPRQKTLRAMIDWSYELLGPDEKLMLRSLAVFSGGWTLEAAEAITEDAYATLDTLSDLADKSLVVVELHQQSTRYRLLETIREYAQNRLAEAGEDEVLKRRHELYFVELAESASRGLRGPDQATWLRVIDAEYDNLRAVMDRDGAKLGYRVATALWWYWFVRGY